MPAGSPTLSLDFRHMVVSDSHPTDQMCTTSCLEELLPCCICTVKNGGFVQNTPKDKQASLAAVQAHVCKKATRADTLRRPHQSIIGVQLFSANYTSLRLWLSTNLTFLTQSQLCWDASPCLCRCTTGMLMAECC